MMKRTISTLLMIIFISGLAIAKKVEPDIAKKVATTFVDQNYRFSDNSLTLAHSYEIVKQSEFVPDVTETTPLMYVFNIGDDNGIILVSGDDVASPVLGYTTSGSFDLENLPYNFRKWLEGYNNQIYYAIDNDIEAIEDVQEMWKFLINGEKVVSDNGQNRLNPLCTTTWNQSPYYNELCPGGSVTGCVATAMAQVMKYWNHPAQGTGMHTYNHPVYGTLSANFGSTTYDWSQMPNSISGPNNAVAVLNYHCGVSVDMDYSPQVSGAWVVEDDSPICAESAFKNYFGYKNSLHGEKRAGYTTSQWVQMMYTDLDAGRPLVYAGYGGGGGHCFIADGYDAGDYFHFNWGWGGAYDGYFHIDALDPSGTGTGGGSGGYNAGHQAIFGMEPETTSTSSYDLRLYSSITVSPSNINLGDGFSVEAAIGNFGDENFNGEFAAYIFDASQNSVGTVEVINASLEFGYYNTYTFSTSGISNLMPGSYTISLYYRSGGSDWTFVGNGEYLNSASLTVGNSMSDIELYSNWNISSGTTITQNEAFDVMIDIINNGNTTFYGMFDVSLYDLDGYFVETVQTLTGAALDPGYYYYDVVFESWGITAPPGTYLLALQHKPDFGNWTLSGSSMYPNPIQVIVREQGEQADVYEPNDNINNATILPVNWSGNSAAVNTSGSNSDNGTDYDYYGLNLPSGYDYTITARVHDSYNSGNGQTYTNDVLWSYQIGTYWSMPYDDIMFGNITVNNGGLLTFLVSPYFLGQTGTYLLDIQLVRTPLSVDNIFEDNAITIFPNPVQDILNLSFDDITDIREISITNISGSVVTTTENPANTTGKFEISVSDYESGTYFVNITTADKVYHKKFIKIK